MVLIHISPVTTDEQMLTFSLLKMYYKHTWSQVRITMQTSAHPCLLMCGWAPSLPPLPSPSLPPSLPPSLSPFLSLAAFLSNTFLFSGTLRNGTFTFASLDLLFRYHHSTLQFPGQALQLYFISPSHKADENMKCVSVVWVTFASLVSTHV